MSARLVGVGITLLALSACSGSTPTAPTANTQPIVLLPSTTSIVQVSITGDELVWIGSAPAALTVKLITSLNPLEFLPTNDAVVWSVEPAGILTVDQRGSITGVRAGIATVSARYGDKIGSLKVRSMPNFAGRWSGRYNVVKCSGKLAEFRNCFNQIAPSPWRMSLVLSQDKDRVSGTLIAPEPSLSPWPLAGTVAVSGELIIHSSVDKSMYGLEPATMDWSSTIVSSGAMAGSFRSHLPLLDFSGRPGGYFMDTENELTGVTRAQ